MRPSAGVLLFCLATAAHASAQSGSVPLLWQTETPGDYETGYEVASGGGKVAVVGQHLSTTCVGGVGCGLDAALRVFDAATGALQWTRNFDFNRTLDYYGAVAIAGRTVIAAGYTRNNVRTFGHKWWIIHAYDLNSGELLWHEMLGDASTDVYPWQIAVKGNNIFVTGLAGGDCATGGDDLTVTAVAEGRDAAESINRFLMG